MYFLIKTAFWLSLVILLIPADPETKAQPGEADISSMQAISAAQQTYVDMMLFCERNPLTCETGGAALDIFEAKARTGARIVYDYLGADDDSQDTSSERGADSQSEKAVARNRGSESDRNLHTGSTKSRENHGVASPSDTLTPDDRQLKWSVPAPIAKPV